MAESKTKHRNKQTELLSSQQSQKQTEVATEQRTVERQRWDFRQRTGPPTQSGSEHHNDAAGTQGGIISRIQIHWGGVLWANNSSSSSVKVQRYIGAWHLPSWHQCQLLFPSKSKLPGLWKGRLQFSAHTNLGSRRQTKGWNQFISV